MNTWQQWIAVLKNAYGSVPPLLQSPIGKFASWIRENYGKDVIGFENTKTLTQLPEIKLDESGKLDLSTIDWKALKQSISQAPPEYQALFDQLTKSNLALPAYSDSVRDFLNSKKLPNGEPLEISYDNKTRTVLVNGKTFLTPDKFVIDKNQRAMSSQDILEKAYTDYLASNFQVTTPETPTTETPTTETPTTTLPDFSKMTATELNDWITGKGYEGEIDYYQKTLDMLNQKDNAITQRINDLWDPYIQSAISNLDTAYNVQKSALESQKGEVTANTAANIANIEKAIMASRARTKEDMNARGLLFSGLLTRALTEVEATGVSEKAKVYAQETSDLNKIAAQIAVLTANLPIEKNNLSQQLTFQKGLQLFNALSTNDAEKDKVNLAIAQTETNIKTLQETAGARGEIAKREEEAAAAKSEYDQYMDWMTKINIPMERINADYEISMTNAGIRQNELNLAIDKFDWTKQMDTADYNLDKWWKEQQLAVDWENLGAAGKAASDLSLSDIIDPKKAMVAAKALYALLPMDTSKTTPIAITDPDTEGLTTEQKALINQYNMTLCFVALGNTANNANNYADTSEMLYKIGANAQLDEKLIDALSDNYFKDPVGKMASQIILSVGGDKNKIISTLEYILENAVKDIKDIVPKGGWANALTYLQNLLNLGTNDLFAKYIRSLAQEEGS